jgi:hypothetical protein
MICPNCKRDYKDPVPGKEPGFVYRVDDNFGLKFRRLGRQCNSCGYVAEWIEEPTGREYFKKNRAIAKKRNRKNQRRFAA